MPEPLDYYNPRSPREPRSPEPESRGVVPVEFCALLTRTDDHAAAGAIGNALRAKGIAFHSTHDGTLADRAVELFVRPADHAAAAQIASAIFARRKKLKSFPSPAKPDDGSKHNPLGYDPVILPPF